MPQPPSLISLSSVCPSWKGELSSSAVESLRRGIELERERFRGKRFVFVGSRYDEDYDGPLQYVDLLGGFQTEVAAVGYAERWAVTARQAALTQASKGDPPWRLAAYGSGPHWDHRRQDREFVRCVFHEQFRVADSGYESKYFEFDVLHVTSAEVIGTELFTYLGREFGVTWHLINRGEAIKPKAEPGVGHG